ncbi:MAG: biotin transporter BioY [Chloroflexi bacterium]|nr:biotin transporter BioY [Chloroflexota bacterium]
MSVSAQAVPRGRTLMEAILPTTNLSKETAFLRDVVLVVGFSFLTALVAQIAFRIPTTTVPITGQTFGALLTGAALGRKRGALSMLLYMAMGMFWLPVFAPSAKAMGGATAHVVLPWAGSKGFIWDMSSGGYIVGFVLAAYLVGWLAEKGMDRRGSVAFVMALGNIVIYAVGLVWLAAFIASDTIVPGTDKTYYQVISGANVLDKTLRGGLYPFIGGDAIKLVLASMALPSAWALVNRWKK